MSTVSICQALPLRRAYLRSEFVHVVVTDGRPLVAVVGQRRVRAHVADRVDCRVDPADARHTSGIAQVVSDIVEERDAGIAVMVVGQRPVRSIHV